MTNDLATEEKSGFELIRAASPREITREAFDTALTEALAFACSVDPDDLTADTTFDDLGFESIAMAAALAEIEEVFDVEIPAEVLARLADATQLETVGDLMSRLTS